MTIQQNLLNQNKKSKKSLKQMFNSLQIAEIDDMIDKIDWHLKIKKLDHIYSFKFAYIKLMQSPLSAQFTIFIKYSLRLLTLQLFNFTSLYSQSHTAQHNKQRRQQWLKQIVQTSNNIKQCYCILTGKIMGKNKVEIMDMLVFVVCLLSREYFQEVFQKTRKNDIKNIRGCKEDNSNRSNNDNNNINKQVTNSQNTTKNQPNSSSQLHQPHQSQQQQQQYLSIQQYTFIILTFNTTGNIITPYSFQYLHKKYIQRIKQQTKYQKFWQNYRSNQNILIQSLHFIKENLQNKSKKDILIGKKRNRSLQQYQQTQGKQGKQQGSVEGCGYDRSAIRKMTRINCDSDDNSKKQNKNQYKKKKKQDKISQYLDQLLQLQQKSNHTSQQNGYFPQYNGKLQKINQINLSKAAKYHYNLQTPTQIINSFTVMNKNSSNNNNNKKHKSQSVTILSKQHNENKNIHFTQNNNNNSIINSNKTKQKYWRQIKPVDKSLFCIKNVKNYQCMSMGKERKENRKNWVQVLNQMKRDFDKRDIPVQKFKSMSMNKLYGSREQTELTEKQKLRDSQINNENQHTLPQINSHCYGQIPRTISIVSCQVKPTSNSAHYDGTQLNPLSNSLNMIKDLTLHLPSTSTCCVPSPSSPSSYSQLLPNINNLANNTNKKQCFSNYQYKQNKMNETNRTRQKVNTQMSMNCKLKKNKKNTQNIKKFKKDFQNKCRVRKNIIETQYLE